MQKKKGYCPECKTTRLKDYSGIEDNYPPFDGHTYKWCPKCLTWVRPVLTEVTVQHWKLAKR